MAAPRPLNAAVARSGLPAYWPASGTTMEPHNRAVVVGALGVIGRYIVERLQQDESWSIVGLSRRGSRRRAALSPHRRRPARSARCRGQACGADRRHAHFLCSVPGRARGSLGLRLQHRAQSRHAGQCRHGHCAGVARTRARGAGDRHQVLRHASGTVQDAGARERSPAHAARLLFRPDRLAHRHFRRARRGTGSSCGRRRCAASRRARR